ncbi:hypothetical protein [Mucilaginibacter aquatilis]|uniref:Uncharacterized protein n=1 Tax=Mucilaginibacter aquatilis TaxID=1517760 RepID=A0A6I4I4Z4_9SPHI|nr:hypothetical protein [Mucilaginibacter aquatilis]MVN90161.1 hypothetical protein [Mucilaginibacter aquatilis]
MNMQDNELDELFRSKLGGLEMQPSAHIWDNINASLGKEKKKPLIHTLSIAATLLVILSAGMWFASNKPAKVEQAHASVVNKKVNAIKQLQATNTKSDLINQPVVSVKKADENIEQVAVTKRKPLGKQATVNAQPVNEAIHDAATITNEPEQILAAVVNVPVNKPVLPEMALTTKTIDTVPAALKTTHSVSSPTLMAQQPEKRRRRGIHSLGGIINAVVSAVDKREDKFIEFTETDEDNANVTGINLGLLKVKKEK